MKQTLDIKHGSVLLQPAGIQIFDDIFRFFKRIITDQYPGFQNKESQIGTVHLDRSADRIVGFLIVMTVEIRIGKQIVSVDGIRFLSDQSLGIFLRLLVILFHE